MSEGVAPPAQMARLAVGYLLFDIAVLGAQGLRPEASARPNGLPSESRQIDQRVPGWITLPPSAVTCSSAAAISATVK